MFKISVSISVIQWDRIIIVSKTLNDGLLNSIKSSHIFLNNFEKVSIFNKVNTGIWDYSTRNINAIFN